MTWDVTATDVEIRAALDAAEHERNECSQEADRIVRDAIERADRVLSSGRSGRVRMLKLLDTFPPSKVE